VIRREIDAGIAVLTMDDGRVNAFDLDLFAELDRAFDACAEDAAIVIAGREGMFSAGLNTKILPSLDVDGLTELLAAFGRTMLRIWLEPRPVVAAATGHAVAGGTILAMAADHAVAADGDYRWGLTETTIGFVQPEWIIAIARGNVAADRLDDLILPGAMVGPAEAVAVGFADALAPADQVVPMAYSRARELAALPRGTYAATKRRLRGPAAEAVLAGLTEDLREAMSTPR
jgi:enoyl-CoA hydratase/carnithine racemase